MEKSSGFHSLISHNFSFLGLRSVRIIRVWRDGHISALLHGLCLTCYIYCSMLNVHTFKLLLLYLALRAEQIEKFNYYMEKN